MFGSNGKLHLLITVHVNSNVGCFDHEAQRADNMSQKWRAPQAYRRFSWDA